MTDGWSLDEIEKDSTFMKQIDQLKYVSNGVLRDFVRRCNIASDEHWWNNNPSPWKLQLIHPWSSTESFTPDYWLERAMNLCEKEVTMTHFGLSLMDLLKLDVCTFEMIEEKVGKILMRRKDNLPKDVRDAIEERG